MEMKVLLKTVFKEESVDIPEEFREELLQEIHAINTKRGKVLSHILIITVLALLFLDLYSSHIWTRDIHIFGGFSSFHGMLLIASALFLQYANTTIAFERKCADSRIIQNLYIGLVMIFCSLIAVRNIGVNKPPYTYIIAMFCIASLIMHSKKERYLVYSLPYIAYIIGSVLCPSRFYDKVEDVFFSTLLIIIALFVSDINYYSYTSNFIKNKIIMDKTKELDSLNRAIEDALKKRTDELNKIVEYDKLRTTFFANISHELRTPLTIIFSAQQMINLQVQGLKNNGSQKGLEQYGNIIRQNCYRLIRIISNLIDITKIDADYLSLSLKNDDVVKIVEDITLSVAKFMQDKGIEVTFDTDIEEAEIACDPDKIERVMLNLLSNAVKFTPKGGNIYINIYDMGDWIEIDVEDTGIGIPEDMKDLIFERFVQVDGTTSKSREGSGIGLALVKSIVEMHGGNISLVSKLNEGSKFIIRLPKRTVSNKEEVCNNNKMEKNNIEMINIEFSDIYF